ncbi:MAG: histidine phosphatase family protein [Rhodospirillales bacterium]|nr:histidine phosphatase family protein [Rhodospirillales bacterium]
MTRLLLLPAFFAVFCLPSAPADADVRFARLSEPGIVAIVRHALAPGSGDPASFTLDDCATQRNLDARGREQARAIGAAIRAAGPIIDRVLTSQWCRCRDTAELLGLGPVEELPALNSFFRNPARADRQTTELRDFLAGLPPGETVILVTHYVNIRALLGRGVASGEVVLLEIGLDRTITVVDGILIEPLR